MKNIAVISLLLLALVRPLAAAPLTPAQYDEKPKLVLVISIDQLRADTLTRFKSRFLPARQKGGRPGGFNHLIETGAYYPVAQYDVLQCMTGPGHAMILSGSYPYQMGIPLNDWWSTETESEVYCAGDKDFPTIGSAKPKGLSPRNFRGTTVGDELKNSGHRSRVVGIALKDRAAIFMAGKRADLALWFDTKAMQWTTSTYYQKDGKLPDWLTAHSKAIQSRKDSAYQWKAEGTGTGLSIPTSKPFEHSTTYGSYESFSYPMGVSLTVDAAIATVDALALGRNSSPDLLAVSFSSHDYLAHFKGPNSREVEELTVHEDRELSRLFAHLESTVPGGLRNVLIALTGDHGGPNDPQWLNASGIEAERIDETELQKRFNAKLDAKFGAPKDGRRYIAFVADMNVYFDPKAIESRGLSRESLENEVKQLLTAEPGILTSFSRTDYFNRRLPPVMFERQILKSYVPGRSGDVVAIQKPYYQAATGYPVAHQTGYAYDRSVPLILSGRNIRPGVLSERAEVVDLAPTLSFLLGVTAPAMSEGRVLTEAIGAVIKDPK